MKQLAALYSGGLDSEWLRVFNPSADLVYFDLGTAYTAWEMAGLRKGVRIVDAGFKAEEIGPTALVPNRNLYLIARLAVEYETVLVGSTADDKKWDNSREFISLVNLALRGSMVRAPLLDLTKQRIYNDIVWKTGAAPYYRTCYDPTTGPCGVCPACKLDGTILKVTPHGWDEADREEIEAINIEALTADGVYRRDIINTFDHDYWVTLKTSDGEIVGYGGVLGDELTDLRVRPKYQGRGFGRLLAMFRREHGGGKTGRTLNEKTVAMWRSIGCVVERRDDGWYYLA